MGEYSKGKATTNRALAVYKSGALVNVNTPQAPEVMLDDAVQVRPDRLRPQQLRNFQGGSSTPTRDEHDSQGDG